MVGVKGKSGKPRKNPRGPQTVDAKLGMPDVPSWFPVEYKSYWDEVIKVMDSQIPKTLSICDGPAIANLATNMALQDALFNDGYPMDDKKLNQFMKLDNAVRMWCGVLLLTPKSRVSTNRPPSVSGNSVQRLRIANGLTA